LRQSAVILARVLGFVEIADLISGGKSSVSELVRKFAEHYSFEKFPQTFEELDLAKGIEFQEGKSGSNPIRKFVIYDTLLVVETRINTETSKAILEEILVWSSKELGLNYKPNSIKRFGYISDVTFFSDAPLLATNDAQNQLAEKVTAEVSRVWGEHIKYESLGMVMGYDPLTRKYPIAPFKIEHRAEHFFSDNKYFSEAPLPTHLHWELIEQFEDAVLARESKLRL
jgi:hypothetical protein